MFVNDVWKGEATQDITAMKETENKLLLQKELFESEQKFRTLVQQASDGIIITDEDDNLLLPH
jgi:PAS domain-containing protein